MTNRNQIGVGMAIAFFLVIFTMISASIGFWSTVALISVAVLATIWVVKAIMLMTETK